MSMSPEFRCARVALASEVDDLGHVSNISYLRWIQDIATAHSDEVGWNRAAYDRLGAIFVVRRHEIDYLRPVQGGEELELVTWVESWRAASSVRRTRIVRDGVEVARASTLWAMVGLDGGRPQRIPAAVREAFTASS